MMCMLSIIVLVLSSYFLMKDYDQRLGNLERQACMTLTVKQEKFCQSYIETGNASEAYRQAYSASKMKPETVNRTAKELLDHPKITARINTL